MDKYSMHRIAKRMTKRFGKIKRGEEDNYTMIFFTIEGNALKVHRRNPAANSGRMKEAIMVALNEIEGHLTGEKEDLGEISEETQELANAILMAFDPFVNGKVKKKFSKNFDLSDNDFLVEYFTLPIKILLRLSDSVDAWVKNTGSDGYFKMVENMFGSKIPHNNKMDYIFPQIV